MLTNPHIQEHSLQKTKAFMNTSINKQTINVTTLNKKSNDLETKLGILSYSFIT